MSQAWSVVDEPTAGTDRRIRQNGLSLDKSTPTPQGVENGHHMSNGHDRQEPLEEHGLSESPSVSPRRHEARGDLEDVVGDLEAIRTAVERVEQGVSRSKRPLPCKES